MTGQWTVQRILVPLDASEHSLTAMKAAVELAASLDAELEGLFVEDVNLLQLSEFPFAQEVSLFSPVSRRLEKENMERQLRIQARRLRQALAGLADRFQVPWTFRVARGGVPAQVLAASEGADLTILGKAGWSMPGRTTGGATVRAIVSRGRGMTLIMQHGVRFQASVQTVFTGSVLAETALEVSSTMAAAWKMPLLVLMSGSSPEDLRSLEQKAARILDRMGVKASFQALPRLSCEQLVRVLGAFGPGPLFLPCEPPNLAGGDLQTLIDRVRNPVFLVRQAEIQDPEPA